MSPFFGDSSRRDHTMLGKDLFDITCLQEHVRDVAIGSRTSGDESMTKSIAKQQLGRSDHHSHDAHAPFCRNNSYNSTELY